MGSHLHCTGNMSTFSALHLLRSYNHLLQPAASDLSHHYHQLLMAPRLPAYSNPVGAPGGGATNFPHLGTNAYMAPHGLLSNYTPYPALLPLGSADKIINPNVRGDRECSLSGGSTSSKRPRGEKKPIPEDLKDERYFERRKRNNRAAKKSRDARKIREDQIAIHASMLERENAIMRAQILSLRDEVSSLRHLLLKKADKDASSLQHDTLGAKT